MTLSTPADPAISPEHATGNGFRVECPLAIVRLFGGQKSDACSSTVRAIDER